MSQKKGSGFLYFAIGGGIVALLIFLGAFIISSRAKTLNPNIRLVIPVPEIPILPSPSGIPKKIAAPVTFESASESASASLSASPILDASSPALSIPE